MASTARAAYNDDPFGGPFQPLYDRGAGRHVGMTGFTGILDGMGQTAAFSEHLLGLGDVGNSANTFDATRPTTSIALISSTYGAGTQGFKTPTDDYTRCIQTPPKPVGLASRDPVGCYWFVGQPNMTAYTHTMTPQTWGCGFGAGRDDDAVVTDSSRHPGVVNLLMCDGSTWRSGPRRSARHPGNKYALPGLALRVFNVLDIASGRLLARDPEELRRPDRDHLPAPVRPGQADDRRLSHSEHRCEGEGRGRPAARDLRPRRQGVIRSKLFLDTYRERPTTVALLDAARMIELDRSGSRPAATQSESPSVGGTRCRCPAVEIRCDRLADRRGAGHDSGVARSRLYLRRSSRRGWYRVPAIRGERRLSAHAHPRGRSSLHPARSTK